MKQISYLKQILFVAITILPTISYGQMSAGSYRYTVIDSLIFKKGDIEIQLDSSHFVAGISNYTQDTIWLPVQDNSAIAILEAKNEQGEWKPIQFWPISGCGNSYRDQSIAPGQTLLLNAKRDLGAIPTAMRLRLHGINRIFVSESFPGTITESLFVVNPEAKSQYAYILCDSIFYLEKPLFGRQTINSIEIYDDDDQ